jgi:hypothetical protein
VLAIGEAHAQKGTERIASTTERFATTLLPQLKGRAGDLVIELLMASGRCGKKVEKRVAEKQAPVTRSQTETAQNEFLALGHKAKALGIVPHALLPNCEEYAAIAASGSNDIELLLQTITKVTTREVSAQLARAPTTVVVTYRGALHNDATAPPGREAWTFGPELSAKVSGAYVELDLIVPEYVKDSEAWRALAWYDAFARAPRAETARLYVTGPQSYALVFPSEPSE